MDSHRHTTTSHVTSFDCNNLPLLAVTTVTAVVTVVTVVAVVATVTAMMAVVATVVAVMTTMTTILLVGRCTFTVITACDVTGVLCIIFGIILFTTRKILRIFILRFLFSFVQNITTISCVDNVSL